MLADASAELADLQRKLPVELKEGPDALGLDDPEVVRDMIGAVGAMLQRDLLRGPAE